MTESFAELFEQSIANQTFKSGEIIIGNVVAIQDDFVVVNAGLKSEAIIPISQFKNTAGELEVNIGDDVEVALDSLEDGFGETKLSREKAKRARSWKVLEHAFETGETIKGLLVTRVKGGFTVDINHVRAFLPGSLVDVRPVRDPSYLEGTEQEFKVIKLDEKRNNVVVSRRAVLELENSAEREELLKSIEEGSKLKGLVKNLTDYGAFVDLGGVDGLLHITDMAWKRVRHPSEIVNVGDEIEVVVLKFDSERNRVSLGMKQLHDDPWTDLSRRYPPNSRTFGKVSNITDYGCFVEIEDGVEGLVHVSEMDWTNKNINPNKVVKLGDETEVMILEIDEDRRRISLGMKQCTPNPWDEFSSEFAKGDKVEGNIKSITEFGLFIGLNGGIDGLVHMSDISWDIPDEEAIRNYKKGDHVEAVILGIDSERERISLGIKQMSNDPMSSYLAAHPKGSIVTGKIIEVDAKAAVIELADGITGILKASEISLDRVEDARSHLNVGDDIEAKFTGLDRKNRKITLSIKEKDRHEEQEAIREYQSNDTAGTSLGDQLKDLMTSSD